MKDLEGETVYFFSLNMKAVTKRPMRDEKQDMLDE